MSANRWDPIEAEYREKVRNAAHARRVDARTWIEVAVPFYYADGRRTREYVRYPALPEVWELFDQAEEPTEWWSEDRPPVTPARRVRRFNRVRLANARERTIYVEEGAKIGIMSRLHEDDGP